ncbi:hypothetical protein Leryth_020573 [Lithospermum erythrorhizon]|nr:hypothetical protein Leryth_020573 [Lithospermum erythrorhizon]
MEVKVISKDYIKPISPTPHHLKTHQLSVLDQLNSHAYIPYLFFYQNKMDTNNEIPQKLLHLKQGLSQTLTRFYPLAGEIKENHQEIDCNDNGVYYVETQVNIQILDLLKNPETKLLHKLLAYNPSDTILLRKTCITMVQVNIFSCGGLVIGLYTSHKMVDGFSATLFWKSWAAEAKGISYKEFPEFDTHEMFPLNQLCLNMHH